MDNAIDNAVAILDNRDNPSKREIRNVLFLVGKKMYIKNIKKLFDLFHKKIEKGEISSDYYFYSDIMLSPKHPAWFSMNESFSEIFVQSDDYFDEDEYDIHELINQAEYLSRTSSINILRDKELNSVMVDDSTKKVVGALWTSFDGKDFSFDVVVAPDYQNTGLGKKLIQSGMQLFYEYDEAGADLDLHVTNPILPKLLQRDYDLKIKDTHPDGTVSMGK